MRYLFHIILLVAGGRLWAQSISPQVLNAAGGHRQLGSTNVSVTDNVGEPFVQTITSGPITITQGFIQPINVGVFGFSVTVFRNDVSCSDLDDGRISTAIVAKSSNYTVQYVWTPSVVCPGNDCSSVDSLGSGQFGLKVIFTYTNLAGKTKNDTVSVPSASLYIADANGPCKVKIYTGISFNGDGKNDHMFIDNIGAFPNNRLTVYNRWGQQLYDEKGYDNVNKFWPSNDEQNRLPASTYFYILDLGDGSKPIKGWVELVKN